MGNIAADDFIHDHLVVRSTLTGTKAMVGNVAIIGKITSAFTGHFGGRFGGILKTSNGS